MTNTDSSFNKIENKQAKTPKINRVEEFYKIKNSLNIGQKLNFNVESNSQQYLDINRMIQALKLSKNIKKPNRQPKILFKNKKASQQPQKNIFEELKKLQDDLINNPIRFLDSKDDINEFPQQCQQQSVQQVKNNSFKFINSQDHIYQNSYDNSPQNMFLLQQNKVNIEVQQTQGIFEQMILQDNDYNNFDLPTKKNSLDSQELNHQKNSPKISFDIFEDQIPSSSYLK